MENIMKRQKKVDSDSDEENKMKNAWRVLFDTLIGYMTYIEQHQNFLKEKRKFNDIIFNKIKV